MVFVGSSEKGNTSLPLIDAAGGLSKKGVTIIAVGMGTNVDPIELKTIVSDPKNCFPQDALDPLKSAVINAALPDDEMFPGTKEIYTTFAKYLRPSLL